MEIQTAELQDQNWNDLKYLLALYRAGSYTGAARVLGVSETTVARRVDAAARKLGVSLMERKDGRINLTDAGQLAVEHAERMEAEQAILCAAISGARHTPRGQVRLTATPMVVNHLLVPHVGNMRAANPEIELELIADPRDFSLSRREADLALRLSRPTREMKILTRRIGILDYAIYTAEDRTFEGSDWIVMDDTMSTLPHAAWLRDRLMREGARPALVTNDGESILWAIRHGVGKSVLPTLIGDVTEGLRRCREVANIRREIWLLVHPEIRDLARIEASIEWLESIFESTLEKADIPA